MNNNYTVEIIDGHHVVTILPKHELDDFKALGIAVTNFSEGIKRIGESISKVGQEMTRRDQ